MAFAYLELHLFVTSGILSYSDGDDASKYKLLQGEYKVPKAKKYDLYIESDNSGNNAIKENLFIK